MNENIKNIKESIKNLQKEIKSKQQDLQELFDVGLKELLIQYPTLDNISVGVNNHDFNDGDATYFSLYYEEPTLAFKDETEYGPDGHTSKIPKKELEKISQEFVDFFKSFDVGDFYESLFGDSYELVNFSWDGKKLEMG